MSCLGGFYLPLPLSRPVLKHCLWSGLSLRHAIAGLGGSCRVSTHSDVFPSVRCGQRVTITAHQTEVFQSIVCPVTVDMVKFQRNRQPLPFRQAAHLAQGLFQAFPYQTMPQMRTSAALALDEIRANIQCGFDWLSVAFSPSLSTKMTGANFQLTDAVFDNRVVAARFHKPQHFQHATCRGRRRYCFLKLLVCVPFRLHFRIA